MRTRTLPTTKLKSIFIHNSHNEATMHPRIHSLSPERIINRICAYSNTLLFKLYTVHPLVESHCEMLSAIAKKAKVIYVCLFSLDLFGSVEQVIYY